VQLRLVDLNRGTQAAAQEREERPEASATVAGADVTATDETAGAPEETPEALDDGEALDRAEAGPEPGP
jgi:hypothetical protein